MQREKTIREQIEDIKGDFCEMCCKHYEEAENMKESIHGDDTKMRTELIEVIQRNLLKKCNDCPLNRL